MAALTLLMAPMAHRAGAQQRPGPAAELAIGWIGFADDGIVSETLIGGNNHSHFVVTGNLTCDLLAPRNGRPRTVTPFLVAGGGLFQTRETLFTSDFTSNEGAFTAGGGVRATAGDRLIAGFDARIGWEPHLRINGFVGVRLGPP